MKHIAGLYIVAFISTLLWSGCCTKRYCLGINDLDVIEFSGFELADLDTVVIKKYEKGSNFTRFVDSVEIFTDLLFIQQQGNRLHLTEKVDPRYAYMVHLKSIGTSYTLSAFESKRRGCNDGFFCFDSYEELSSYNVNGQKMQANFLKINK